jgi:inhibitor of cysteine peptidase
MSVALRKRPTWCAALLFGTYLISRGQPLALKMPANQNLTTVREKDKKSEVSVPKDGILVVRLSVSPGTGFSWHITSCDRNRLKLLGDPVFEGSGEAKPGESEEQVFRFKALTAGPSILRLAFRRGWEKDAPPARTFEIKVKIQ